MNIKNLNDKEVAAYIKSMNLCLHYLKTGINTGIHGAAKILLHRNPEDKNIRILYHQTENLLHLSEFLSIVQQITLGYSQETLREKVQKISYFFSKEPCSENLLDILKEEASYTGTEVKFEHPTSFKKIKLQELLKKHGIYPTEAFYRVLVRKLLETFTKLGKTDNYILYIKVEVAGNKLTFKFATNTSYKDLVWNENELFSLVLEHTDIGTLEFAEQNKITTCTLSF